MRTTGRTLALCICTATFFMGSCIQVTDELDLNKEISLDMQIGPGGLSIPFGSLSKIYLDSLIKIDGDNSVLDTIEGGLYGISMDGTIDKVNVSIGDVTINIPNPSIDPLSTSFENPEPDDVKISPTANETVIAIDEIDLSGINNELPKLKEDYSTDTYIVPGTPAPIAFSTPIAISEQSVAFKFSYNLPKDVKKLNKIYFGSERGVKTGQKTTLNIDLSGIFNVLTDPTIKVKALNITFPDEFELGADDGMSTYIPAACVTVNKNVFSIAMENDNVSGLSTDNTSIPVSFYIKSADFSNYTGTIDFDSQIKYSFTLEISGTASSKESKEFKVGVNMESQTAMSEIDVDTKGRSVDISEGTVTSSCVVGGLDGISKVETITFKEGSMLYLTLDSLAISPFEIAQSSNVNILFPDYFVFDDKCKDSDGNDVGTWATPNSVNLNLAKSLGKRVCLNVKSMDCSTFTIDNVSASMNLTNNVSYSGNVDISDGSHLGLNAVDVLNDKVFKIVVGGDFIIDQAVVETGVLSTEICDSTEISINEPVDVALVELKRIDLTNPAGVSLNLRFSGVPSTIDELTFSRFTIEFPEFIGLQYTGGDARIKVEGNHLIVNGVLKASELADNSDGFVIEKLAIAGMYFDDPLELIDGHIVLDKEKVRISGSVTVNNQKINSNELNVITVVPTVTFDPVVVKSIYGKVNPKIDEISQSVSLDMGDDIDFLKADNNNLKLSDPRITLNLNSSVTVPILLDLNISSKNSNGEFIAKNIKPDDGIIRLDACDSTVTSRHTTLVISKYQRTASATGDTVYVCMSRLPELMKTVPDSVIFNLVTSVDQTVNHYVDLTRELAVSGDYKVSVPLSFDSLYIEYSDTIKDLGKDLEDISDKIEECKLKLMANVESTIPLGVRLTAKALDAKSNEVNGIVINPCVIGAGSENGSTSAMRLEMTVAKGALKNLDALVFTAACESGDGADGSSLKKGQYIHVKDIKLNFPEGLRIDFTESKENK